MTEEVKIILVCYGIAIAVLLVLLWSLSNWVKAISELVKLLADSEVKSLTREREALIKELTNEKSRIQTTRTSSPSS